jgi:hypothetical protein
VSVEKSGAYGRLPARVASVFTAFATHFFGIP